MQDVKEGLKLDNLHTDHVMIRSELKYLIGAKIVDFKCRVFGGKTAPISYGPGISCGKTHCNGTVSGRTEPGTDPGIWTHC
jgi:hypothetical protein